MNHVEATGKTIEDAVRSGLVQLGLTRDEVTVEVLAEPKSGFLGIGSKPAVVRVTAKEEAEHVLQRQQEDVRKAEEAEKQTAATETKAVAEPQSASKPAADPAEPETASPADDGVDSVTDSPAEESADSVEDFTAEEAAAKAREFLQEVLKNMGMQVMIEKMIKPDKIILHLHGKNLGILIGKHGQTLDALQYLTNLTTNQGKETRHFIMLDVENYRHRREETLKQLALRLSGRVKKKGDKVVLEPMNGYERKIIHVALQDAEHVRTESEGQDPYRHVVIYYAE
ncbi:MAG: RNA-binding cell elongation regulator Jag/EloR [Caecibacter massiliensis]|uniref:RNA-binding cell elongation regulator Jag/EloR n=1 Tax=uncultured Megasphaera sp. TaxID=165188 RepID=UPI00260C51E5|nr:RNA-binding cell elongation regulator Jag/EloR [uncultured Megasphaera sp.]MDY2903903.1 RNA-binding cell elongation regulator Jag/EloR [Caecibacter massiliensis]